MASLIRWPNGHWSTQYLVGNERKTISLGQTSEEHARMMVKWIESLVRSARSSEPLDKPTAKWVAGLSDDMHARLAKVGLVTARAGTVEEASTVPTLAAFLDSYINGRKVEVKRATATIYGHVRRCLVDYFGATRPLERITPGDADEWRLWLVEHKDEKGKTVKLADNTVRRRCGIAKQFFRAAVRKEYIVRGVTGIPPAICVKMGREWQLS